MNTKTADGIVGIIEVVIRLNNGIEYTAEAASGFNGSLNLSVNPPDTLVEMTLALDGPTRKVRRRKQRPSTARRLGL